MPERPDTSAPRNIKQLERLRAAISDLEARLRSLGSGVLRHDVGNAIGAARNALVLLDEGTSRAAEQTKFVEMAERNVSRAQRLLSGELADTPRSDESRRDERDDLRSESERDHRDALGN
jgi:hypothetical protein